MPIVAIELNDYFIVRQKGINTEFISNKVLRNIANLQFIQERVSDFFKFVGVKTLLLNIHFPSMINKFRTSIPALVRTKLICPASKKRQGSGKSIAACLTRRYHLISTLPLVCVLKATKIILGILDSILWEIKNLSAEIASNVFAVLWRKRRFGAQIAISAAILNLLGYSSRNSFAASLTNYGSYFAHRFCHRCILPYFSAYAKPIALIEHIDSSAHWVRYSERRLRDAQRQAQRLPKQIKGHISDTAGLPMFELSV